VKVVDGDTLHVLVDGRDETVRIIGINAPETDECWGTEATQAAARLLDGASVGLVADPTQDDRDRYGRLLRYVLLPDGTDVGQRMIADGNADEYTYDNPYANQRAYRDADAAAAAGGRGWWSAATCDGNPAGAGSGSSSSSSSSASSSASSSESAPAASAPAQTGPNGCDIKGNISANGKIYHLPGGADYDRTRIDESRGERWFCSVAEAQAAGWRARN
jgi:micrococcal nuclease